ncbi:hypothetical protein LTR86_000800 [Recurvomyces mirabilis]|nr:hypothetical protein LTR86_000800 [Recurvomyces mirabilis]
MEKIKSILKPGGSHHDEARYAKPESSSGAGTTGVGSSGIGSSGSGSSAAAQNPGHVNLPDQVRTDPGEEKKESGILRQILNPGGEKYDEQAYGTTAHAVDDPNAPKLGSGSALQTHPVHETDSKDVSRQILNPGGEKYDPVRYGSTAQADRPLGVPSATTVSPSSAPQIEPLPAAEDKQSILRQVLNPGGDKYDEQRYGVTGKTIPGTETSLRPGADQGVPLRTVSSETVASGMPGPYASNKADKMLPGTEPTSSTTGTSTLPERSRDVPAAAGLAGIGAAAAHPTSSTTSGEHGRSFPLSGGATSSSTRPTERHGIEETMRGQPGNTDQSHLGRDAGIVGAGALGAGALAHHETDRSTYGTSSVTDPTSRHGALETLSGNHGTSDQSHLGRDAGIVGAGALGAGALGHHEGDRLGHDDRSTAGGLSSAGPGTTSGLGSSTGAPLSSSRSADIAGDAFGYHQSDERPHEGYVHHTHGPHATDTANRLDPHVPGEFPDDSGLDRHSNVGRDAALGGVSTAPSGPVSTDINTVPHSTSGTQGGVLGSQRETEHHYGRDAALGAVAGTAGLAGYEALKDHDRPHQDRNAPVAGGVSGEPKLTAYEAQRAQAPTASSQSQPHHLGRDAGIAAGTGAAGVAGYEALKDHNRQGDRVQEQHTGLPMDMSKGTGEGGTDANPAIHGPGGLSSSSQPIADMTRPGASHPIRDAAVGGGAGAAGLGGASAFHNREHESAPLGQTSGLSSQQPHESHLGRDTALGAGAGAAGVGGYEALKHHDNQTGTGSQTVKHDEPHHTGRDAALAGGAGAAGVGAYEASHDSHHGKLEKTSHQVEKHEKDLEKAREKEAKHGGDHGSGEKKESFLHKLLHPGGSKSHEEPERGREHAPVAGTTAAGATAGAQSAWERQHGTGEHATGQGNVTHEKHTGLPMDLSKGTGEGGTDGASQIHGPGSTGSALGAGTGAGLASGTSAMGQHDTLGHSHGSNTTGTSQTVNEPHTGLPMDMSKGTGVGGTDGASQIHPHGHTAGTSASLEGGRGTTGTGVGVGDGSGVEPAHGGLTKHDWYGPK